MSFVIMVIGITAITLAVAAINPALGVFVLVAGAALACALGSEPR